MRALRSAAQQLIGLFIDDGSHALAIILWVLLVWFVLPRWLPNLEWRAIIMTAGLGTILIENVYRSASRRAS